MDQDLKARRRAEMRPDGPQRLDEVLRELLRQYEARFPHVRVQILEIPTAA